MQKMRLLPGLCPGPHWGSSRRSPRSPSRLGRGHPSPDSTPGPRTHNFWLRHCRRGAEYCNQFVCLSLCVSVCPRASLEQLDRSSRNIFVQIPRGHGSVLLWRRCPTLCTSGFMDDVTFGRSGPYGDTCLAALRSYRGGVWCVWMSCYFVKTCFGGPHSTAWKGWKPVTYTALQWRSQRNNMVPTQTYEY